MKVEIFYNPKIVNYTFFKQIYDGFGLPVPTSKEMQDRVTRSDFLPRRDVEIGWTTFGPITRSQTKKLVNILLASPFIQSGLRTIEIKPSHSED